MSDRSSRPPRSRAAVAASYARFCSASSVGIGARAGVASRGGAGVSSVATRDDGTVAGDESAESLAHRRGRSDHGAGQHTVQDQLPAPVQDGVDRVLGGALAVRVLDPQQVLAAVVAGEQPVEERGTGAADMEEAGGGGGNTDFN